MNKYSKWIEDKILHYPYADKWTAIHMLIPATCAFILQIVPNYWLMAVILLVAVYGHHKKLFGKLMFVSIWIVGAGVVFLLESYDKSQMVLLIIFIFAVIWEIIEWRLESTEEYGGLKNRILNTISDVVVAMIMVFFIVSKDLLT